MSQPTSIQNNITTTQTPQRQIRAHFGGATITVYQAYNTEIATAAVQHQSLDASPAFSFNRMTWIKPSWTWMMYRCGYSYKDAGQARVLAIRMKHENFIELLRHARLAEHESSRTAGVDVVVQWDPERSIKNGRLDYRSIQIGISRKISEKWVKEWIEAIEDVTDRAQALKKRLDACERHEKLTRESLEEEGLLPVEAVYDVPEDIRKVLGMMDEDM